MASDQTIHPRHHWPTAATELYLRDAARIEAINGPFGAAMFDAVQLRAGERVLDVGCGLGTTTLDAARLVSRNGSCCGHRHHRRFARRRPSECCDRPA